MFHCTLGTAYLICRKSKMYYGSLNFLCVLIWVLQLIEMTIWVLNLMLRSSRGPNPATTPIHVYVVVAAWMRPSKTCKKTPLPHLSPSTLSLHGYGPWSPLPDLVVLLNGSTAPGGASPWASRPCMTHPCSCLTSPPLASTVPLRSGWSAISIHVMPHVRVHA
jgi:hypothetical protein